MTGNQKEEVDAAKAFEALGVPFDVTSDGLKREYHKLALKYHPDRNSGGADSEERFKRIQRAYDVLGKGVPEALEAARRLAEAPEKRSEAQQQGQAADEVREEQGTPASDAVTDVGEALRGQARAEAIRRALARDEATAPTSSGSTVAPSPSSTDGGSQMRPQPKPRPSAPTVPASIQSRRQSGVSVGWVLGIVGTIAVIAVISIASHGGGMPANAPGQPHEPTDYTCDGNELETSAGGAKAVTPTNVDELRGAGGDGDVNAEGGVHILTPGLIGQKETILIRVSGDFSPRWCRLLGPFNSYWETVNSLHIDARHIVLNDYPDNGACEVRLVIGLRTGHLGPSHIIQNGTDCEHEALTIVLARDAIHAEGPRP